VVVGWVGDVSEELAAFIFTVEISSIFQNVKLIKEKGKISIMFDWLSR
jgi:hypothetical protein